MRNWKITGIIATIVVILSIPAYMLKQEYYRAPLPASDPAVFVGGQKCAECHKAEFDKWKGSHHDLAMDEANDSTVLGDFNDAEFEYFGQVSKFYRKNGKFFVYTPGPEGKMGEYEIQYTFGVYPLQQYLVSFPGGRLQCLPITWDVREKKMVSSASGCTGRSLGLALLDQCRPELERYVCRVPFHQFKEKLRYVI